VVQVTSVMPVAKMVGSNRIVQGGGIVHVLGDPDLPQEEEKKLRHDILKRAFDALQHSAENG
jgi:glycine reductase complex component B subunit gamma